jgi:hypothetical protein
MARSGWQLESCIRFCRREKTEEFKSMPLDMQPLSNKFGVAITNLDLSKDIDGSLFDEVNQSSGGGQQRMQLTGLGHDLLAPD